MRAKITQALVDRTPYTSGGTKWIYDTELRGFSLAVGKTVATYYAASEASGRSLRVRVNLTAAVGHGGAQTLINDQRRRNLAGGRDVRADVLTTLHSG